MVCSSWFGHWSIVISEKNIKSKTSIEHSVIKLGKNINI